MSLRMVEMMIPASAADELIEMSEDLRVLGHWREPLDDDLLLLRVLVHGDKAEAVIEEMESRFKDSGGYRLVIFEVQATLPHPEPEPEEEEAPAADEEDESKDPKRIACAELVQKLESGGLVNTVFLVTVALSTVVAMIGLIRDSVPVIIGAMVIAPLLGPNMTLSLATTLGDIKLAARALSVLTLGLAMAFMLSALIGFTVAFDISVPEISVRTELSLNDITLALAAGAAGALSFTTGLSEALVGVMVAAALLPPIVAAGLLLGIGEVRLAAGALLLTASNVICINLAGVATFLVQRVHPRYWWEAKRAKRMIIVAASTWLFLLIVLVLIVFLAYR